jgi:tetratricopeptide (TPR) repeat protein
LLLQNRPLPLATLFSVDTKSPYYHEENKGSIFYAQSWALVHYFEIRDLHENSQHLADYAQLLAAKVDPVTAATRAFGDLNRVQASLENYIHQGSFSALKLASPPTVDPATFQARPLTAAQADAVRADFLAYNDRAADARPLLEQILKDDPQNVSAHETMGFLQFRAGHVDEARKWYEKAVKLDSQSYLAHYYFAAMSMNDPANPADDAQVESSLRLAIKLNPSFAPSFERMAAFDAHQHKLEEAQIMALTAVQLDPANVGYRMTTANILMEMERVPDALTVLRGALRVAKSPAETMMVENFLSHAQDYANAGERQREQNRRVAAEQTASVVSLDNGQPEEMPKGPHRFVVGQLQGVVCHNPRLELSVASNGKSLALHSGNYYKIEFTALGFTPKDDLNPCKDLEGRSAKVVFIESSAQPPVAHVVGIELHK